ncbi:SDR family oxidoreductase [Pseudonocardia pini]|uniref:SDR family oxidoreductase n=1 Tax=Pseudonocardia pini TaxID=2758030 RepID=UPI0015F014E0|nr:SDR family oxidoreductase [Pseudonocardia pini]
MSDIRYDDRVALVTGAGAGLGRAHALLLAERGALVVANDLGGSRAGEGSSTSAAEAVVAEIRAAGGTALANTDSVADAEGAARMVQAALDTFGRLDIVVNNAGILRDVSYGKMSARDWEAVLSVHLDGTHHVTHAAWPHLRAAGYGRIVNTTSASGLYGNFGQVNYGAAKMGIVGLTRALAVEGASKNILVNCVAPAAASRLTEDTLTPELFDRLRPEYVASLVGYLVSDECTDTGRVYAVGGGYVSRVAVLEGQGAVFADVPSPERIRDSFDVINDLEGAVEPLSGPESVDHIVKRMGAA